MRVRDAYDVDDRDRYVISKYFGIGSRATREQVKKFMRGAFRGAIREYQEAMTRRQQSHAQRLIDGAEEHEQDELIPPREKQLQIQWTEGDAK